MNFYWAAHKGNAQSRITFHLCQKGKTWRKQLSGRLANRFGSRLETTTKSLIEWSYWRYIFAE